MHPSMLLCSPHMCCIPHWDCGTALGQATIPWQPDWQYHASQGGLKAWHAVEIKKKKGTGVRGGEWPTSCRAVMFLWRSLRMMATSRFRSSMGLRLRRPPPRPPAALCASSSTFFTIWRPAATPAHEMAAQAVPCWQLCCSAAMHWYGPDRRHPHFALVAAKSSSHGPDASHADPGRVSVQVSGQPDQSPSPPTIIPQLLAIPVIGSLSGAPYDTDAQTAEKHAQPSGADDHATYSLDPRGTHRCKDIVEQVSSHRSTTSAPMHSGQPATAASIGPPKCAPHKGSREQPLLYGLQALTFTAYKRLSPMSMHRKTRPHAPRPRYLMTTYWLTKVQPRSFASFRLDVSLAE